VAHGRGTKPVIEQRRPSPPSERYHRQPDAPGGSPLTSTAEPVQPVQPARASRGRLGLLHHPDFAKLWVGDTISQFGTQITFLAIPIIGAAILNAPPEQFALLGFFDFLPFILISLPAGVWVDRLRRRPILISADLVRAVVLLSIPIAYELNILTIWQLYAVGFINGVATVFFDVAYQSYLPSLVERDEIVEGNSKLEVSRSSAAIVGPGFAGILIGAVTAPVAVIVDAISFVVSAVSVFFIRRAEPPIEQHEDGKRPSMVAEARAGLGYVVGNPYLRAIGAGTGTSNLFSNIQFSIFVLYMVRTLLLTPVQIGLIFAIGSIGPLVGALVANRIAKVIGVGPAIIGAIFLQVPSSLLIAIAPPTQAAIPLLILSGLIGGFSGLVYNINQVSYRQAITPQRMQGRMNASMRFIVWGTIPPGQILGGVIAATFGISTAIWIGALGAGVPTVIYLFSPFRSLRNMPKPVDDEPPSAAPPSAATLVSEAVDETPERTGSSAPLARPEDR
jgi:MFS family permease